MNKKKNHQKKIDSCPYPGVDIVVLIVFLSIGASISLLAGLIAGLLQGYHSLGLFNIAMDSILQHLKFFLPLSALLYFLFYHLPISLLSRGFFQKAYATILSLGFCLLIGGGALGVINFAFFPDQLREIPDGKILFSSFTEQKVRFICVNLAVASVVLLAGYYFQRLFLRIYTWKRKTFRERAGRIFSPTLAVLASLPIILLVGLVLAKGRPSNSPARPNILLIVADTLRRDHMSCYGYGRKTTPNLDRLADSSLVFENAYSQAPLTVPSLASLLTGTYPSTHRVSSNVCALDRKSLTMAEVLKNGGYQTAAFVSNGVLLNARNLQQGFDVFDNSFTRSEQNRDIWERIAEETTNKAADWLRKKKKKPFFLMVHYQDPHGPYLPPAAFQDAFLGDGRNSADEAELPFQKKNDGAGGIPPYQRLGNMQSMRFYVSRYDEEILYMDHWVGELFESLRELHLFESTIIVFTADHGESLGEHNHYFQHGQSLHEELIQVPLLIRPAGEKCGRRKELIQLVDLFPTLLDLSGIARKDFPVEGRSFAGLLNDNSKKRETGRGAILSEKPGEAWCLRTSEWKLIYQPGAEKESLLYHVAEDPHEKNEVGDAHPKEVAFLLGRLLETLKEMPKRNPPQKKSSLTQNERKMLQALGYVE